MNTVSWAPFNEKGIYKNKSDNLPMKMESLMDLMPYECAAPATDAESINIQNTKHVKIPTLEELQQRFHAVPRFRDPNKREYVWFHADDVARVFGYSDFNEDLMNFIHYGDRVCVGKKYWVSCGKGYYTYNSLGPECQPFLHKCDNVINQFGVAQLAKRTLLPLNLRFRYWLYSTWTMTDSDVKEPVLHDLEIVNDGSCVIEARKQTKTKLVVKRNEHTPSPQETTECSSCDIEYEREVTKRLEIEKNYQLEMRKIDLRQREIEHEYHNKFLKNNV